MYPSVEEDDDLIAALCFDQSNGVEDPYAFIHTDQENLFPDFGSCGLNLQQEQEHVGAQFNGSLPQGCSVGGENNDLRPYGGVVCCSGIGSISYSGVLQQELNQAFPVIARNEATHGAGHAQHQELEQICRGASVGAVKEEQEHVEEECSRKRGRTGSCSKPGTKACREKLRREQLNEKFTDLSSVLEPARTPKTDKSAIIDDAIRVVNQLRDEAHELKETNQKLVEEIKSLKAEKNELKEEKLVLKADKEKMEQQLKSVALPTSGFMPTHPAAFHPNKMAVYPSFGYYPNMPMWPYLHPSDRDTSHDHLKRPPAA